MSDKIPAFNADGLLPPGDYEVTFDELRESPLVLGPKDKDHPNDIDGYFACEFDFLASGQLQRELNLLDPQKVWTWDPASRKAYPGYPKKQLPMWHIYRVELYPHFAGMGTGILDRYGNELEFPSAFRQFRRDGRQRGIVKLIKN